jgi:hypothetical protein
LTNLKYHPPRLWSKLYWLSGPFLNNISACTFHLQRNKPHLLRKQRYKVTKMLFYYSAKNVFTHILNNKSNGVLKLKTHVENYLNDSGVFILIRSTIRLRLLYTSDLIQHLLNKHELIRSCMEIFN